MDHLEIVDDLNRADDAVSALKIIGKILIDCHFRLESIEEKLCSVGNRLNNTNELLEKIEEKRD